jgi:hypothetical protein
MARVPITSQELHEHLGEQTQFLKASCDAFDQGADAEAKRIATVIRVLVHDTGSSHSLLGQLGMKDGYFFDSAPPVDDSNLASESPLLMFGMGKDKYLAPLDSGPSWAHRGRPFDGWWNDPIFKDDKGRQLSRRELILTAANQDGGAHIDPSLDEAYADLAKNNSLGWTFEDGKGGRPMSGATKAAIRQIGHEMLRTLNKEYRKELPSDADVGAYFYGVSINAGDKPQPIFRPPNALIYSPKKPLR